MGGVYLSEGKNGGSILRWRKKWGEDTLADEGRVIMSTPPLRVFLAPSLIPKIASQHKNSTFVGILTAESLGSIFPISLPQSVHNFVSRGPLHFLIFTRLNLFEVVSNCVLSGNHFVENTTLTRFHEIVSFSFCALSLQQLLSGPRHHFNWSRDCHQNAHLITHY